MAQPLSACSSKNQCVFLEYHSPFYLYLGRVLWASATSASSHITPHIDIRKVYLLLALGFVLSSKMHCLFFDPALFFIASLQTQKLTHKPWPIATIILLSPVVAQVAVSFAPSPSPLPLTLPLLACHLLPCSHCLWCRRRLPLPSLLPLPLP